MTVSGDVTFTAEFTEETRSYLVTLDLAGGIFTDTIQEDWTLVTGETDVYTKVFKVGDTITLDDPAMEGYTFSGWDPELPETMPAENLTVTATWTAI